MRHILIFVVGFFFFNTLNAQTTIADARGMNIGDVVTIEGVATNGGELGIIRYLQDATGAVAVYPGAGSNGDFPGEVNRGDLVTVTGALKEFNGLLELDPVMSFSVVSSNNDLPEPFMGTPNDLNEGNEAILMTISNVKFDAGGNVFGVGNFTFSANGDEGEIYVRSNHPMLGEEIPLASVDITGVVSQFNSTYQLLPRGLEDIVVKDNFFLTSAPRQTDITNEGFTVSWETNAAGNSVVRYGTTSSLGDEMVSSDMVTSHSLTLTGLDAGEFYYVEVSSDNGTSEVSSAVQYYSTASNSTGEMRIYFNYDVNGSVSNGSYANGYTGLASENAIINLIENAQSTIDASVYNNNRDRIVNALTAAHNRGVVVRYVADNETANLALSNPSPPFSVIRGNVDGLMHNKFLVVDANSLNDSWVLSGSTNWTQQNIVSDYNNMVIIQDQALAKAYTIEFEEMWGSEGPQPGIFNVRFGPEKTDNTPHNFIINGMPVEQYFSPSDNTTLNISKNISQADSDLQFALLTFTNNELGTAVANAFNRNVDVRGIIDNINDQGGEFAFLEGIGVDVTDDNTTTSTHHKYCIIDAKDSSSNPTVVTGSHNWSGGAETRNDENTLIFHDDNVANIFLQEFEARWCEVQGGSNCTTSANVVDKLSGISHTIYPNPVADFATVSLELDEVKDVTVNVLSINGQVISSVIKRNSIGKDNIELNFNGFAPGTYLLQITADQESVIEMINVSK